MAGDNLNSITDMNEKNNKYTVHGSTTAKPRQTSSRLISSQAEQYWLQYLQGCEPVHFPYSAPVGENSTEYRTIQHDSHSTELKDSKVSLSALTFASWALVMSTETSVQDVIFGEMGSERQATLDTPECNARPTIPMSPVRVQISKRSQISAFLDEMELTNRMRATHGHIGLDEIRNISDFTAKACSFQTLIAVHPKPNEASKCSTIKTWTPDSQNMASAEY